MTPTIEKVLKQPTYGIPNVMVGKMHSLEVFKEVQKLVVIKFVVEYLQVHEGLGKFTWNMQDNLAGHYLIDLEGTWVSGPNDPKDDGFGFGGTQDQS